jgi:1-acyl-sn-glycerol-3-phosphate acyltransferase
MTAQAYWLHQCCRRLLRVFKVQLQVNGPVPKSGLLVCNHLSYLDVLVLSASAPAIFVAKREVKCWPIFGWFARLAGTVFADRGKRMQTGKTAGEIHAVLNRGLLVVLFPEGTSSDGQTVLPFKSALLEPVAHATYNLAVGWIQYEIQDGSAREEVCYWKDMTFVPHLLNLLTKRRIFARVRLSQIEHSTNCRKEMARQLHSEVSRLKSSSRLLNQETSQGLTRMGRSLTHAI